MQIEESETNRAGFQTVELYRPIERELGQVREQLMLQLRSDDAQIDVMCKHVSRYQGKLLRPAVLLLSGKACGSINEEHITYGVIIELLHLATLIHDDVLDQASLRRKSITTNELWGNEASVLLGDYLLSRAFDLCNKTGNLKINQIISGVAGTICQGELLQCMSRGQWDISEERYLEIIHMKTGCLYQVCCRIGAELSIGSAAGVEALDRYGLLIGRGFQIADDLLDIIGTEPKAGKTLGSDLAQAKPTLPTIHFYRESDPKARGELIDLIKNDKKDEILALLKGRGSLKYTQECAEEFIRQAKDELKTLEASQAGQALAAIADFVVRRSC
jgi:octaprenyl-diphosphate synthase